MSVYSMEAYKHYFGQTITTDVEGICVDRAFIAHLHIKGADVPAASNTAVLALTDLVAPDGDDTGKRTITTGITSPVYPRNLKVVSDTAGITSKVKIYGYNMAGVAIDEEIQLNGKTAVAGLKVFKTITKIDLPAASATEKVSVGFDDTLGFPYNQPHLHLLGAYLNNTAEATAPTIVFNAAWESNTIKLNSALAGTNVDVYFIV